MPKFHSQGAGSVETFSVASQASSVTHQTCDYEDFKEKVSAQTTDFISSECFHKQRGLKWSLFTGAWATDLLWNCLKIPS